MKGGARRHDAVDKVSSTDVSPLESEEGKTLESNDEVMEVLRSWTPLFALNVDSTLNDVRSSSKRIVINNCQRPCVHVCVPV